MTDRVDAMTERLLADAGICAGLRVLDLGCGGGDVSLMLVRRVGASGEVVCQEHGATLVPGRVTPLPLHDQVQGWIWQTAEREGANVQMGFDLANMLEAAGLTVEQLRAEAAVQTHATTSRGAAIVRAMLPRILEHGVASAAEIDLDTLEQRLAEERAKTRSTYLSDMVFGAWARKPQA